MKLLVALCVLALVALSSAATYKGHLLGCVYVNGHCSHECEAGTHSYTPGCVPLIREPTCDEPNPQPEQGVVCDFSSCYCNSPTVRDTTTKTCVTIDKCPQKNDV